MCDNFSKCEKNDSITANIDGGTGAAAVGDMFRQFHKKNNDKEQCQHAFYLCD